MLTAPLAGEAEKPRAMPPNIDAEPFHRLKLWLNRSTPILCVVLAWLRSAPIVKLPSVTVSAPESGRAFSVTLKYGVAEKGLPYVMLPCTFPLPPFSEKACSGEDDVELGIGPSRIE